MLASFPSLKSIKSPPEEAIMNDVNELLAREAGKRKKQRRLGTDKLICPVCGETHPAAFDGDHVAGRKFHDQTWPLCKTHHAIRTDWQGDEPPPSDNPRNPLEVIGHWLLGMAAYFEMLIAYLKRFGTLLIDLAKEGYGADLELPKVTIG
jgi:hypothetical protein